MTRSAICNLAVFFLLGCPGGSDKDAHTDDTAEVGLDVSELLCAGLEDPEGSTLVPTRSVGGCSGGEIAGQLTCAGCELGADGLLYLNAIWTSGDPTLAPLCTTTAVTSTGSFTFGRTAPFMAYTVHFSGRLRNGQIGDMEAVDPFEVCSDDVWVEAEVEERTDGW